MKVLLDTNFMLIPGQFRVDIFESIDKATEEKVDFYILDVSLKELEKVSKIGKMRDRTAARIGLVLAKKAKVVKTESIKNVDTLLLEAAVKYKCTVATQDKELKDRLKKEQIPVYYYPHFFSLKHLCNIKLIHINI